MITFKADDTIGQLKDWAKLSCVRVELATAKALNSSANAAKKHAVTEIPRKYAIEKGEVSKRFRFIKANENTPAAINAAYFRIKDKPLPLVTYPHLSYSLETTVRAFTRRKGGVFVREHQAKRYGVWSKVTGQSKLVAGAFIATVGKGKHIGIFIRGKKGTAYTTRGDRLPIREKWGPSVAQIVKVAFIEPMVSITRESFAKLLPQQLKKQQREQDAGR